MVYYFTIFLIIKVDFFTNPKYFYPDFITTYMYKREITSELEKWLIRPNRKPLILRGARQVDKTTLVNQFSKNLSNLFTLI